MDGEKLQPLLVTGLEHLKTADCRVLTYFDTVGVRLLPWSARSPDHSLIEHHWSWVAERLGHHRSAVSTIDKL
ncbi:hypothetical protein TNCV_2451011 [Trichonephila clavipes]|nr:hypothetical protein TNCV_2451011 [Trichonephila clavipes]